MGLRDIQGMIFFRFRLTHQVYFRITTILLAIVVGSVAIASQVPSPKSVLGFHPTDAKTIADWGQITDYFARLDRASKKVTVKEIGRSTKENPMIVAFISSESNIRDLEKYRSISARLADPRTIASEAELANLIKSGKTIVSISCSIHSTEIVASQMSMNLAYELASAKDPETKEILDNTILLLIPSSNPDGIDIVANWYRKTVNTKSDGASPPELYHHYAGHDNNRDWFMLNLAETRAITQFYWKEWFPQIVFDVHQQGQNGSRMIIPPFFDPPNPRIPPALLRDVGLIGYKMAADLQAKGYAGVATNASYDTWWHGGFRSAPYYHNSIGILSEAASANLMSPANISIEDLKRGRGRGLPSVLEPATNFPDPWKGGEWRPADIAGMEMSMARSLLQMAAKYRTRFLQSFHNYGKANLQRTKGDPFAFIVTAGQPNTRTISRFLEILMAQGIEVYEMKQELWVKHADQPDEFHELPLGGFLIFVDQPQKNNVLSLFEKQVYPDRRNANGEAESPYDVAGWTLPLQMGVQAETILEIRDLEKDRATLRKVENIDQARAVMNLSPQKEPFEKLPNPLNSSVRIGLYKGHAPSMDEGWTRLVLDNFQIPYRSISDSQMRSGDLPVDVLILPADSENTIVKGLNVDRYPAELAGGIGDAGIANLKKFVKSGGRLVCFDDSCELVIKHFELPIKNVLSGLRRNEFYNPGSIVQLSVDNTHPLGKGLLDETAAYFINSSAFEITDRSRVRTVARYADSKALLSGWMLGEKFINGKTALAEAPYGSGKLILFGFRPQHRGQTWATFPFVFNALTYK